MFSLPAAHAFEEIPFGSAVFDQFWNDYSYIKHFGLLDYLTCVFGKLGPAYYTKTYES